MFAIDKLLLLAAVLILFGVLSSKLSARLGLPVLVLFLITGMLAGENGIGGIVFDNAVAAHALGTLALALILFDGGLQTPVSSIRKVWKPASLLATVGVLATAAIAGLAAAWMLELPVLEGMLLGAIIGSTDAAAVFSLLRNAGIHINQRLKSVLEIESASNDPMAIFLTVGLLEVLVNSMPAWLGSASDVFDADGDRCAGRAWCRMVDTQVAEQDKTGRDRLVSGACCGRRIARLWSIRESGRQRISGDLRRWRDDRKPEIRFPAQHLPVHGWPGMA